MFCGLGEVSAQVLIAAFFGLVLEGVIEYAKL